MDFICAHCEGPLEVLTGSTSDLPYTRCFNCGAQNTQVEKGEHEMNKTDAKRKARKFIFTTLEAPGTKAAILATAIEEGLPTEGPLTMAFLAEYDAIMDRIGESVPMIRTPKS